MKQQKDVVTYHYYNCNPHRKLTSDCVVRAICSSMGESWESVLNGLVKCSIETGYFMNTQECYGKYLKEHGYVKQKQPTHKDGTKMKFSEFSQVFDGHAVCHCGKGHMTYVADNAAWDIWDVSDEVVGNYWVNEAELGYVKKMEEK